MKLKNMIPHVSVAVVAMLSLAGCASPKGLVFANREWHVSDYYGQIIDRDTTYRMTFGELLLPDPMTIISCADSVAKYPGLERYLADILHTCRLDSAEILFYVPNMYVMFAIPKGELPPVRPSSLTAAMDDERPYTMWVYDDDVESWRRKPEEMYTYTFFDRRKQRLLIVNHYDYGDTPIAQITILQSRNKTVDRMGLDEQIWGAFFKNDLKKMENKIEFWAHWVDGVRKRAFDN